MQKVLHFIGNHWVLVAAFIVAFLWLMIEEARHKGGSGVRLTPQKAVAVINHDHAAVLDIRDASAFEKGHIVGAINIPAKDLEHNAKRLEKYKQKPLILVCATGQKAAGAMNQLRKKGHEKVYILAGGIGAWKSANMPLVKG